LVYLPNDEIAKELYLSKTTVKSHIHNLLVKFKAKTRCELLLKAIMKGEIQI
jgi:DNA-binding NarL/FixJ family response regulator